MLPLDDLRALWDTVPTERQRAYKAAYDREVRAAGALGSDQLERRVTAELLARYRRDALVPVGLRWARAPQRVQAAAIDNALLSAPEDDAPLATKRPSPGVVLGLGLVGIVFAGVLLLRLLGGSAEPAITPTPAISPTPTPAISPTPTPLALEAQDDVIQRGDAERAPAYPVNLQITTADGAEPRVWVVQRRRVDAAEWRFDPNPDTASFLNGMSVRPVIGIPWSDDNAAFFAAIDRGAAFRLTLNTGAVLHFVFDEKRAVRRSEMSRLRQVSPGLVLLLIGELDADGLPTATRTLITATYPPQQELARDGQVLGLSALPTPPPSATPTLTPTLPPFAGLDVHLISAATQPGQLTTRLWLYNGGAQAMTITPNDITLALGYAANPPGPRLPAEGLIPLTLLPGQAVDLTLVWPWADQPYGVVDLGGHRYGLRLNP